MNGRDFVPPRSVHVPPPLLSGLAMESHRLGASAAAGRISSSPGHLDAGHPVALHSGKFPSPAITIHSQHSDAFPGASGFLCDLMSLSNPHVGPAPLPSDPAFRAPNPASLQMAQLWAFHLHKAPNHEDEKQADEQTHRHDCLLSGSLEREREREQEKVLRESNGLADYTQVASASVLIPNLMVTGGPSLGEDHWATDPTSHLASHPWLPCSGATSMWLPGSPYELEMLERGPPLWSAVYPPAGSCLQHTHELQLLSHQQLMRQQQLYMIQQEASPVMELQRNASFMERLKEQPANLEDKSEKRGGEAAKGSLLGISAPVLHGCKPRPSSLTPSTSYRTARMAQTPLPVTPLPSPVTTLRSKERPKGENTLLQLSFWHPSSPASASPPPPSPICPKQESVEVPEKDELNLQKRASASFPCLYPEIPCGYPYESVTASFGRHYPHLHQPAAGANGLALAGPLQAEQRLAMPPDIKPRHLCSPVPAEASREPKPIEEPNLDHSKEVLGWDCSMEPLQPAPLLRGQDPSAPSKEKSCLAAAASPLPQENEEDQDDKVDIASSSHQGLCQILGVESDGVPAVGEAESPLPFPEATHVHSSSNYSDSRPTECRSGLPSVLVDRFLPVHDLQESTSCDTPDLESTDDNLALSSSNVTTLHPTLVPLPILPEYPMAGMFALVTASEMPQAGALATLTEMASPGAVPLNLLEMSATEGMSRPERDVVQGLMHYGLESLLRAGRQVLLDTVEWQPQVSVRLPRELDPNKKYSWRQKDKPMFSKSSLEAMDAIEVDYRVRLAELQHRYKDKQRELFRLQRHRDEAEKQQQLHQQCEERSRGLAKRGPGRPPKRKLGLGVPSPPSGKLNTKCGKSSLYSEDSESREMLRKRSRAPNREEEDADGNVLRPKKRSRSWHEQESSSSYSLEVSKAVRKKSQVSEQKQLALKLNKALSFTKLSKLNKVSCKLAESPSGSIRAIPGNGLPAPLDMDMRNNMAKSSLAKDLNLFHKSSKEEYFTEREDYEDYDDDDKEEEEEAELDESDGLCSSSLKESGLGLLACFAASAIPSPVTSSPLSLVHLKAKQKATKEERQSLLGVESEFSDSESEVKICQFPSLLHGKRSVQELPLLPPANVQREDSSPSRRCRKPKAPKLGLDFPADGSAEAHWTRHRSERILLHDTAQANPFSPTTPKTLHRAKTPPQGSKGLPSAREAKALVKKKRVKESPLRLPPPQLSSTPSDSSSARPVCPGRKSKVNPKAREQARGKCCAVSKLMESMAVDEDFEPNQDSSFSEDENPPPITLPERPCTPAPRHCVIDKDGLRVLIPMDEQLLYAGHINTVHSPDIYRVVVEGERGNRPHIYCLEQLLQEAIIDVKPPSVRYLPQGTRIAAYWSQQYRCLYPGTVVRGSPDMDEVDNLITVEFDDGDTGRILLSHIRLLPPGYKIQCAEPSPALLVACTKRRSRKCVKDVSESKETKSPEDPALKDRGRGRKPKTEPEVFPKEHEKPDASVPSHALERPLSAQKNCSRPGKTSLSATTTGSSIPMPTESQKKATLTKPAAKMRSQPHSVYLSAFYRQVMSVDLYNDPSTLLASFVTSNDSGEAKPVKQTRKSKEEGAGFGVKAQRKQPEAEILIKLDHEGVMSPKTKKTKALMMMMERQNSAKTDNKAMMSVGYATLATAISADKKLKPKRKPEQEAVSTDSLAAYGIHKPGGGSEHPAKVKSSKEKEEEEEEAQSASSNSCSSESEGEEERSTSPLKVAKRDSSSTSCCASSPTSPSSSSSSSSSSAGFSCSSSSSPTSEEESSCSSVEEAPTVPQPHYPQEQASAQEEEEDAEEMMEVKSEPPATSPKAKKQQAIPKQQQKQQMVKKSAGRPKREDVHLSTTKALAKRQRLPSVENRPKISAFLPARQLWKWFGKPTQRWGMKGKVKKLFYKAIMRGKEMIHIGDCAVFLSAGRPNLPFIGHIHSMWESWGNNMVVRVKWFYHPEETNPGKKLHDKKNWDRMSGRSLRAVLQDSNQRKDFMERALYQSSHIDENDVQTISHKCLVVSLEQYEQMVKTKKYQDSEDLYYLVGTYKPTTGMIFSTDGIPVIY